MKKVVATKMVFVDESAVHLNMQREYAWSPVGERAYVKDDRCRGKAYSLISSISCEGMLAPMLIEGSVDTKVFLSYIEDVLLGTIRSGQIVVMDNCSIHNKAKVRTLLEPHGIQVWFLPAYSPDLSPIELAFSKIKHSLKATGADTLEVLFAALKSAIDSITLSDIWGWFRHCDHHPHYL